MSHSIQETKFDETQDDAIPPLSGSKTIGYSLANFGFGMFYALNNAVLSLFLEEHTKNAIILSLMSSSDSIEGVVVQPIVGAASDRMRSPLGRRRPFMLMTIPIAALFMVLTPLTAHLPISVRLTMMIACVVVFTILFISPIVRIKHSWRTLRRPVSAGELRRFRPYSDFWGKPVSCSHPFPSD